MAVADHGSAKKAARKTRRSKKRRTAESSDSDSSSSSSSESESGQERNESVQDEKDDQPIVDISDVELSDAEDNAIKFEEESLGEETKKQLNQIPLTITELSSKGRRNVNNIDLSKIQRTIQEAQEKIGQTKDEGQLKNAYLSVLFKHYGEDVNSLREAPDFTPKSLVLLANVLKDGGHMFDIDTLRAVVESEH